MYIGIGLIVTEVLLTIDVLLQARWIRQRTPTVLLGYKSSGRPMKSSRISPSTFCTWKRRERTKQVLLRYVLVDKRNKLCQ